MRRVIYIFFTTIFFCWIFFTIFLEILVLWTGRKLHRLIIIYIRKIGLCLQIASCERPVFCTCWVYRLICDLFYYFLLLYMKIMFWCASSCDTCHHIPSYDTYRISNSFYFIYYYIIIYITIIETFAIYYYYEKSQQIK